jgi:hypothetical protein
VLSRPRCSSRAIFGSRDTNCGATDGSTAEKEIQQQVAKGVIVSTVDLSMEWTCARDLQMCVSGTGRGLQELGHIGEQGHQMRCNRWLDCRTRKEVGLQGKKRGGREPCWGAGPPAGAQDGSNAAHESKELQATLNR